MEIVHFSSFVVLNVGHVQGMLAGQSSLTLLSQEMFLAVGTRDLGLMAGLGWETLALVPEWAPLWNPGFWEEPPQCVRLGDSFPVCEAGQF